MPEVAHAQNFAVNLVHVCALYSVQERRESNVSGKREKPLNKVNNGPDQGLCLSDMPTGRTEDEAWPNCVTTIDESSQRLNCPKRENTDHIRVQTRYIACPRSGPNWKSLREPLGQE